MGKFHLREEGGFSPLPPLPFFEVQKMKNKINPYTIVCLIIVCYTVGLITGMWAVDKYVERPCPVCKEPDVVYIEKEAEPIIKWKTEYVYEPATETKVIEEKPDCPALEKHDCQVWGDGQIKTVEKTCYDGSRVTYSCNQLQ